MWSNALLANMHDYNMGMKNKKDSLRAGAERAERKTKESWEKVKQRVQNTGDKTASFFRDMDKW
jgi:hypothetical protein